MELPSEKFVTIAKNMPKVYESSKTLGKLELLQDSKYMNAQVSGTAIAVNDVSPIEHKVECSVSSRNLLDPNSYTDSHLVCIGDDGSIDLSMEGPEGIPAYVTYNMTLEGGDYVVSLVLSGKNEYVHIFLDGINVHTVTANFDHIDETAYYSFKANENAELRIDIYARDNCTIGTVKIQLEKGTTPTLYTPYMTDFSGIEVSRYGKNLLPSDVHDFSKWTVESGSQKRFYFDNLVAGQAYTFSFKDVGKLAKNGYFYWYKDNADGSTVERVIFAQTGSILTDEVTFTVESGCSYRLYAWFQYHTDAGMLENNIFKALTNFQLELGSTATAYEPYIEPQTVTANADGTVDGVKSISPNMTLLTNNNGVVINANYLRDIDTYIDNLITDVALTGGE